MDPKQFDTLTRALMLAPGGAPSRRSLLTALGGLLAGLLAVTPDAAAKKDRPRVRNRVRRRQKRRDKNACPTGQLSCDGKCAGCCADTDCGGNACRDGQCAECPRGQRLCRGGCLAETACCSDGECTGGQACVAGACACRANERLCQGTCIPNDACCGADCPPRATCSPENCRGCCDGVTCRDGEGRNFCGRDGTDCLQCGPNELCNGETCFCPTECCSDADCSAVPDGVCLPDGACEYPCVPLSGACIDGVTECCDPSPLARCFADICQICAFDGEFCTANVPCCEPDETCDIASGRCLT